jgi:hypothetical protein
LASSRRSLYVAAAHTNLQATVTPQLETNDEGNRLLTSTCIPTTDRSDKGLKLVKGSYQFHPASLNRTLVYVAADCKSICAAGQGTHTGKNQHDMSTINNSNSSTGSYISHPLQRVRLRLTAAPSFLAEPACPDPEIWICRSRSGKKLWRASLRAAPGVANAEWGRHVEEF